MTDNAFTCSPLPDWAAGSLKNIAVIPARGGSKRIPRKNVKAFHGKPMIQWSIEAALGCDDFDAVIVSTDDPEIAEVAIKAGALVPFQRPAELSDDHIGVFAAICHAIEFLRGHEQSPENICCLFATAPFVTGEILGTAKTVLDAHPEKSFAFSATAFPAPVQRGFTEDADGNLQMLFPEEMQTRSQDLAEVLHDAGMFYWGRADGYLRGTPVFSSHGKAIRLPQYLVHDIDTPEDWERAELLFPLINESEKNEALPTGI